jgi:hypothetical protein
MIVSVLVTDIGGDLGKILIFCPDHCGTDLASLIIRATEATLRHGESTEGCSYFFPGL